MKKLLALLIISTLLVSCAGDSANNNTGHDSTATATDTITGNTNPGVGSAVDDTAILRDK